MTTVTPRVEVFTDGAYSGTVRIGGWAWAQASIPPGKKAWDSGGAIETTSQRMEMLAVIQAIQHYKVRGTRIRIVSDSAYVVNCFQYEWFKGWNAQGRKKKDGHPVANWDYWSMLIPLVRENNVTFRKVRGHSGDPMNDFVDKLAVKAKIDLRKA